jgi:pSer/pThr/pTyr-binding forkhead associated (FHA) protein
MAVRINIRDADAAGGERIRSFVQDRIVIGRARYCDICLPDMAISTRHAEIRLEGTDYAVVDLGSLNGTTVNGKKLVAHRPRKLTNDDRIAVAGFELEFRLGVSPGPAEPRDESLRQAREMLAAVLATSGSRSPRPALLVVGGPAKAGRLELPPAPARLLLGRSTHAELKLDDRDVSREHAELLVEDSGLLLRDLGSRYGIVVGGERVEQLALEPGRQFTIGGTTIALEHPVDRPLAEIVEAPEEETSSFTAPEPADEPPAEPDAGVASATRAEEVEAADEEAAPLPVGPEDPLAYPGQPGYVRTTKEIPRPAATEGSDLGLIVVGAIIVVAAVVALILLFT